MSADYGAAAPRQNPGYGHPPAAPRANVMKRGMRLSMRNWRLRTKVIAVIVVPTLTALVLVGLRAQDNLDRAADFRATVSQVELARNVTSVVHELQKERTLAVARIAANNEGTRTELDTQIGLVDQAVSSARSAAASLETDDEAAKTRYNIGLRPLSELPSIRGGVEQTNYPDSALFGAYTGVLDALIQLGREISTAVTDRNLLRESSVIQSISEAKEDIGRENAILQIAALRGQFSADLLQRIRDAQSSSITKLADFRANASTTQQQLFNETVSGPDVYNRQRIKSRAVSAADASTAERRLPLGIDKADLTNDGLATLEHMRTVETDLLDSLRDDANALVDQATEEAWRDSAFVLLALLAALGLMTIVTRSLLEPLRILRREALEVANRRLPASVQRILADPDPAEAAKHAVEPVAVFTREETGQLARSFDAVQEQAILMATEQALLRDNINSIFVNLSRRSQALVERQLSLIERLEQDEQDPDQLASLFELDHLATRMRRNSESLLVLSGTGLSRQLNRPVPVSEVVGAAVSEVEHYTRIDVTIAPDVAVQGRAVSDLVHVIAELLDNATFFSEPEKKVLVRMAMTRKKELAIQITDNGVSMSEDEIDAANARLADPPDLDVSVTRRMGLYVVARLAKRHNIIVRLRDNEDIEGGLIARINVPTELVRPIGAPSRSMSATSTTSSLAAVTDTGSLPVRNAGIAGAFGSRRPDGDTSQPRTPEEIAGYPTFSPGGEQTTEATTANGSIEQALGGQNGRADGPSTLFGTPLPEPPRPAETSYPQLGASALPHPNTDTPTERLPVYEAVLSQWFEAADTGATQNQPVVVPEQQPAEGANGTQTSQEPDAAATPEGATSGWTSPGDDGWLAAQALLEATPESQTTAGLPRRVPKAHLVPGSAAPRHAATAAETPAAPPLPPRSAEAVRGRMSSFQQGVRRGRHALIEAYAGDQSGSEDSRKDEEQE
ncbi:nitrate- and nitrite sensing domain-containing protein [Actinophytocola sp.]|uniref:sensor histidine kinase n=1 Tax=Actinophytocola sp. TaxID=1872138 RepID=UPI003D6A107E